MMIPSCAPLLFKLLMVLALFNIGNGYAEQYKSFQLVAPKGKTTKEVKKTISELEKELNTLKDEYTRDSTTRFLARHYAQLNGEGNIEKALIYYNQALSGNGLSNIAKQEMLIEIIDIQYFLNEYALVKQFIKQFQDYGGKLSIDLQLKLAFSQYHLKQPQAALLTAEKLYDFVTTTIFNHAIDPYVYPKLDMSTSQLTQLLFIFFENKRYNTSIELQTIILESDHLDADHWIRLSQIYLVDGQSEKAANTLLLAAQKGIELNKDHILLLSDLMVKNNNPYIAARFLKQMINEFHITAEFTHYEKLFSYWYLAHEIDKAIEVANIMVKLLPSIDRRLDIAELYYQTRSWNLMKTTILEACDIGLGGQHVGRANYLLGISELKLNNIEDAARAFNNASLIGGYATEASRYLDYINVKNKSHSSTYGNSYRQKHEGPCGEEDSETRGAPNINISDYN
ncbi:hypothetical protein NBRC116188_23810 [Oceaniserpentilla sp. 4NH20-0058]|uniref:tetratricopeptide repeat protein n=1 Tax=Oceaniserpentilla sp. 4NH20-0058 TaxID=3127660 RepID=UPI00310B1594